ncbi:hypothetical protein V8C86DRAFT_2564449 [Haematococcus lacustris]
MSREYLGSVFCSCVIALVWASIAAAQQPLPLIDCTFTSNATASDAQLCPILNANSSIALVADSTWGTALSCSPPAEAVNESLSQWISSLPVIEAVPYGSAGPFAINLWFKPENLTGTNTSTGQFLFSQVPGTLAFRGANISAELNASAPTTNYTGNVTQAAGVPSATEMLNTVLARRAARNATQPPPLDSTPASEAGGTVPSITRRTALRHLMQTPPTAESSAQANQPDASIPTITVTRHASNESRASGATFPNQIQVFLPAGSDPAVGTVRTLVRDADDGGTEPLFLDSDGLINNLDGISNDPFHPQIREGVWHMLTITTLKASVPLSSQSTEEYQSQASNTSTVSTGTPKGYAIYLDGMLVGNLADTLSPSSPVGVNPGLHPLATGGGPMRFGNGSIHVCVGADLLPDSLFLGRIAHLKIFDHALNMEEIQRLNADDMATMTAAGKVEAAAVIAATDTPVFWSTFDSVLGAARNQSDMTPQQQQQQQVVVGPDGTPQSVGGNPYLNTAPPTEAIVKGNDTMPDAHGVTVLLPEDVGRQSVPSKTSAPLESQLDSLNTHDSSSLEGSVSKETATAPPAILPLPAGSDSSSRAALPVAGGRDAPDLHGTASVASPPGHGMVVSLPEDMLAKTVGSGGMPEGADGLAALNTSLLQQQQQKQRGSSDSVVAAPSSDSSPSLTSTIQSSSSGSKAPIALSISLGVSLGVCAALAVLVAALLIARARRPEELALAALAGTLYAPTGLNPVDGLLHRVHRGVSSLSRGVVPAPSPRPQLGTLPTASAGLPAAGTVPRQHRRHNSADAGLGCVQMPPSQLVVQDNPAHATLLVTMARSDTARGDSAQATSDDQHSCTSFSTTAPAVSSVGGSQGRFTLWGSVNSLFSHASRSLLSNGPTSHQPDTLPAQGKAAHSSAAAPSPDGKLDGKRRILALPLFTTGKQHGHAVASSPPWRNLTLSPKQKPATHLAMPGIMASPRPGPAGMKTPPAKSHPSQTGNMAAGLAHPLDSPVSFGSRVPAQTTPGSFSSASFTTARLRHTAGGACATPGSVLTAAEATTPQVPAVSNAAKQLHRAAAASSFVGGRKGAVPASPSTGAAFSPGVMTSSASVAGQSANRVQTRLRAARAGAESSSFTAGGGVPGALGLLMLGARAQTEPGAPPSPTAQCQPPTPQAGGPEEAAVETPSGSKQHAV